MNRPVTIHDDSLLALREAQMRKGSTLEAANRLFAELYAPLMKDAHTALKQAKDDPSAYNRRVAFRVVFSAVEGLICILKDGALAGTHHDDEYSSAEVALLREEEYILDNRGRAITKTRFIRVADNLLFAWRMFFREVLPDFKSDLSGDGWRCFSSSLVTRNRITHPKSGSDLELSDQDMHDLETGFDWVIQTTFSKMAGALLRMRGRHYERLNQSLPNDVQLWLDSVYIKMSSVFQSMKDNVEGVELRDMEVEQPIASSLKRHGLMSEQNGELQLTADASLYMKWRVSRTNC